VHGVAKDAGLDGRVAVQDGAYLVVAADEHADAGEARVVADRADDRLNAVGLQAHLPRACSQMILSVPALPYLSVWRSTTRVYTTAWAICSRIISSVKVVVSRAPVVVRLFALVSANASSY